MAALTVYQQEAVIKECTFETARSGGAGGQHVNKVESKVTIVFDIEGSAQLSLDQKKLLCLKLGKRVRSGVFRLSAQTSRSQFQNKQIAIERLLALIEKALLVKKRRVPTKISRAKKEVRLKTKRHAKEKKKSRRRVFGDGD